MSPVLHHTRASCAAQRSAEESYGGAGTFPSRSTEVYAAQGSRARSGPIPGRPPVLRRGAQSRRASPVRKIALLGLVVAVAACSRSAVASSEAAAARDGGTSRQAVVDASLRFEDSQPTLEALGRHVLAALAREDEFALERVRLTEREHNEVVWPELPASAPHINYPVDYAWTNIENRNRRGVSRLLSIFANGDAEPRGVECRGGTEEFETFVVHTDCWVVFAAGASPERWEIQLFKDALERSGGYKIFRYYDEEPRPYRGPMGP